MATVGEEEHSKLSHRRSKVGKNSRNACSHAYTNMHMHTHTHTHTNMHIHTHIHTIMYTT